MEIVPKQIYNHLFTFNLDDDVNIFDITSAVLTHSLLNGGVQCATHCIEVSAQGCSHHDMLLAIWLWVCGPCKSHSITTMVLVVEELTITSHIEPKVLAACALAIIDNLLDQRINLRHQSVIRCIVIPILTDQGP